MGTKEKTRWAKAEGAQKNSEGVVERREEYRHPRKTITYGGNG